MREALVYAVGVAFSPVPIASVLLVLTGGKALPNGAAFTLGWAAGVSGVATVLVVLVEQAGLSDADPLWIALPEVALGVAFLAASVALIARRGRAPGPRAGWVSAVDELTARRSAGLGALLSAANPKVVALALGAALSLAEIQAGAGERMQTVVLFTLIGLTGVGLPVLAHALFPRGTSPVLARLRAWLERHETSALVGLGLVIGIVFLQDGVASL